MMRLEDDPESYDDHGNLVIVIRPVSPAARKAIWAVLIVLGAYVLGQTLLPFLFRQLLSLF